MQTQIIGNWGESYACDYLIQHGLKILSRNFRAKTGEIDIIAQDHDYLVFVEVRVRFNKMHSNAAESINLAKRRKILKTAEFYLQKFNYQGKCRIDVIAIDRAKIPPTLEWIKNAISY